jgi:hypothetical protein
VCAFTGTGFGWLTAAGGAFQSELPANSRPLIEKIAPKTSTLDKPAAKFRALITCAIVV